MPTAADEERAQRGMNRAKILYDDFDDLALAYVASRYATPTLAAVIGEPDTSSNIIASLCRQLTTPGLYGVRPEVRGPVGTDDLIGETGYLARAPWLSRMPHVQYLACGMGDVFVRWDVPAGADYLTSRVVLPYDVYLEAPTDRPDAPHLLMERRLRQIGADLVWCWDVYDLRPDQPPAYRVVRCEPGREEAGDREVIGAAVVGRDESWVLGATSYVGDAYPWKRADGTARLPWSRYRWADQGALWNDLQMRSATKSTLASMFLWTLVGHSAKSAAMGKFYLAHNVALPAEQMVDQRQTGSTGSTIRIGTIDVLPGTMVPTTAVDPGQAAQLMEMGPSGDVVPLLTVAQSYELMAAMRFGLAPGDLGQQANPTSAQALTISAAGRRAAAAQCEEVFRVADLQTIACAADVLRSAGVADFPGTGYTIAYQRIARTPEEDAAEREEIDWAVDRGHMGPIEAYRRRHPGVDEATARAALIAAAKERADIEDAIARYRSEQRQRRQPAAEPPDSPGETEDTVDDEAEDATETSGDPAET